MGMAVVYLLLVAAGSIGALLALLWLFPDTPDTVDKIEGTQGAEYLGPGAVPSVSVESERWEDEAA